MNRVARYNVSLLLVLCFILTHEARAESQDFATRLANGVVKHIDIGGLEVSHAVVIDSLAYLTLIQDGSASIAAFDQHGREATEHRFKAPSGGEIIALTMSRDVSTVMAYVGAPKGEHRDTHLNFCIFSTDGTMFFERVTSTDYDLSPSGRFLSNRSNELADDPFLLLDRDGREVLRSDRSLYWTSAFLSDDTLLLAVDDSLFFISSNDGTVLLPCELGFHGRVGNVRVVTATPYIAVFDWHSMVLYSNSGHELWRKTFVDDLQDVAFDLTSGQLLLCVKEKFARTAYSMVTSIHDPDSVICTLAHEALSTITPSASGPVFFRDGLVVMWSPRWVSSLSDLRAMDPRTIVLDVSSLADTYVTPEVVDGLYMPFVATPSSRVFIDLSDATTPRLLTLPHQIKQ